MSSIQLWDDQLSFSKDDILLFIDEDYYEVYKEDNSGEINSICYILSPNISEGILPMIFYYLYLKHGDICLKNKFLNEFPQFKLWENIIDSLNFFDTKLFEVNFKKLKDDFLFTQYPKLYELIETYFLLIVSPPSNSLYFNTSSSEKKKLWFSNKLTIKEPYDKYIKNISSEEENIFTEQTKNIVQKKIKIFNKLIKSDNKPFYLSAYCYQLALYYFKLKQNQISFLLLHRTLDFYLQSRAIDISIIVPTEHGMKFKYTDWYKNKPVGIYYLEKCLVDFGDINFDNERKIFFTWINDARNTSLLTHGVFNIEDINVVDAISKTLKHIEKLEGSKKWEMLSKEFSLESKLDRNLLYTFEPSIELYFNLQETLV